MKPTCLIKNCKGKCASEHVQFCPEHQEQWINSGRPQFDELVGWLIQRQIKVSAAAPRRREVKRVCLVPGCGRKTISHDLCTMHRGRWESAGEPVGDRLKAFLNVQAEMPMTPNKGRSADYYELKHNLEIKHGFSK
jgi:hypothetical protein